MKDLPFFFRSLASSVPPRSPLFRTSSPYIIWAHSCFSRLFFFFFPVSHPVSLAPCAIRGFFETRPICSRFPARSLLRPRPFCSFEAVCPSARRHSTCLAGARRFSSPPPDDERRALGRSGWPFFPAYLVEITRLRASSSASPHLPCRCSHY